MSAKYYVTAKMLTSRGACPGQVRLFRKTFGSGQVEVTTENVSKAIQTGLEVSWLAAAPFWMTRFGSSLESEAMHVWDKSCGETDPKTLVRLIERSGPIWNRIKAGER